MSACSASRNASGVAGVVLEAPALADPLTPCVRRFASFVAATVPSWQIPGPAPDLDGLSSNKEWIQRWVADETVFHGRISWLLGATALRESLELWNCVGQWSLPTLLLHGDKDTYTTHKQSQKFVETIASVDKEFYSVKDGRHDMKSDRDAVGTWVHVIDWIDGRLAEK